MNIVRLTKSMFELEDGSIYPINPPLKEDLTIEEFQKHYNFAVEVVESCRDAGAFNSNIKELAQPRKD